MSPTVSSCISLKTVCSSMKSRPRYATPSPFAIKANNQLFSLFSRFDWSNHFSVDRHYLASIEVVKWRSNFRIFSRSAVHVDPTWTQCRQKTLNDKQKSLQREEEWSNHFHDRRKSIWCRLMLCLWHRQIVTDPCLRRRKKRNLIRDNRQYDIRPIHKSNFHSVTHRWKLKIRAKSTWVSWSTWEGFYTLTGRRSSWLNSGCEQV